MLACLDEVGRGKWEGKLLLDLVGSVLLVMFA